MYVCVSTSNKYILLHGHVVILFLLFLVCTARKGGRRDLLCHRSAPSRSTTTVGSVDDVLKAVHNIVHTCVVALEKERRGGNKVDKFDVQITAIKVVLASITVAHLNNEREMSVTVGSVRM